MEKQPLRGKDAILQTGKKHQEQVGGLFEMVGVLARRDTETLQQISANYRESYVDILQKLNSVSNPNRLIMTTPELNQLTDIVHAYEALVHEKTPEKHRFIGTLAENIRGGQKENFTDRYKPQEPISGDVKHHTASMTLG